MLRLLGLLIVVGGARSAAAPFVTPCKAGDNACLLSSAQAALPYVAPGIPELGIKPVDPLHLEYVKGDSAGLQLTMKDTTVTGMKGCVIDAIKHDISKKKQSVSIRCSVQLSGDYKLDGQILVLPIRGEGKYKIDIHDIIIKAVTDLEIIKGEDGKDHWHIQSWKHNFVTKTGAKFDFKNLFNGNKVLAGPVLEFVNSNWADVMREVGPPIVYAIVEPVIEAVEALYKAVPAEELALN